jgi:hypothetical protein
MTRSQMTAKETNGEEWPEESDDEEETHDEEEWRTRKKREAETGQRV